MVGMESARSGFSEFDGKKDGNILNAIKQANIDNDDNPDIVKDIEEEDFEIDPAVGKKQGGKSGKRGDLRQGISGLNFKDALRGSGRDSMKSEDYKADDDDLNALDLDGEKEQFKMEDSKQEQACLHRLLTFSWKRSKPVSANVETLVDCMINRQLVRLIE